MSKEFQRKLDEIITRQPPSVRKQAERDIKRISDFGITSFQSLLDILQAQHADIELRTIACWIVGQLRNKRALKSLLSAFNDRDVRLTWEASKAIALIGNRNAFGPLIEFMFNAEDANKRQAAAYALGNLHNKRAVGPLSEVLKNDKETSKVRGQACESLTGVGDKKVVAILMDALKDSSAEVRFWAAFGLGNLGDKQVIPELRRVAKTDKGVLTDWGAVSKEASAAIKRILSR